MRLRIYPTSPCNLLIRSMRSSLSSATHSTSEFINTPLISFQSMLSFAGTLLISSSKSPTLAWSLEYSITYFIIGVMLTLLMLCVFIKSLGIIYILAFCLHTSIYKYYLLLYLCNTVDNLWITRARVSYCGSLRSPPGLH